MASIDPRVVCIPKLSRFACKTDVVGDVAARTSARRGAADESFENEGSFDCLAFSVVTSR